VPALLPALVPALLSALLLCGCMGHMCFLFIFL
jgi:hypothetical protein